MLLQRTASADMEDLGRMLLSTSVAFKTSVQPFALVLVRRAREHPEHPQAATLLTKACTHFAPDSDAAEAPTSFREIADLIIERYASSPDIANFCEVLGRGDYSPPWAWPFEPHLRQILDVNQDRFVRCSAMIALASLVQASEESRQPEAENLFEQFLAEFDGKLKYHAAGIEQMNRASAVRQLEEIRSHGLGKPAPETVGIDLDGKPMALTEYRGKVVLVSYWATWCYPCMKMIPHEKVLVGRFAADRFAIVGVNSDTDLDAARRAVVRHEVAWRSFRNAVEGKPAIANLWKVVGYPTLYLLDSDGIVRKRWIGNPPPDDLHASIERLMAGAADEPPSRTQSGARRNLQPEPASPNGYMPIDLVDDGPTSTGWVGKVSRASSGDEVKYVVFIPHGYDNNTPAPAILYLHGSGYIGTDGRKQLTGALANAIKMREREFPYITIFPQSHEGSWEAAAPDGRRAIVILDEVSRDYAVDTSRVYLTGPSMGGEGTWSLAAADPNRWAAIVPLCGGGDPTIAGKIKSIPCWCFQGDADRSTHPQSSRRMVIALREAGGRPIYHEYPGVDHNCWDLTYARPDLYEWLLQQKTAVTCRHRDHDRPQETRCGVLGDCGPARAISLRGELRAGVLAHQPSRVRCKFAPHNLSPARGHDHD